MTRMSFCVCVLIAVFEVCRFGVILTSTILDPWLVLVDVVLFTLFSLSFVVMVYAFNSGAAFLGATGL